ncbi:hypothetical protein [Streptomyces sp. NBC_01455]|uniref:hypothetical protein n=1 Tax=Streptomyces sp. NBC_01455 TaxID=2903874 RepID=UPI002E3294D1|nr:hypothetical protein [Streptomyces sp. NBC_01455]
MPSMDGIEATGRIVESVGPSRIPALHYRWIGVMTGTAGRISPEGYRTGAVGPAGSPVARQGSFRPHEAGMVLAWRQAGTLARG